MILLFYSVIYGIPLALALAHAAMLVVRAGRCSSAWLAAWSLVYLGAVAALYWGVPAHEHCAGAGCDYVMSVSEDRLSNALLSWSVLHIVSMVALRFALPLRKDAPSAAAH